MCLVQSQIFLLFVRLVALVSDPAGKGELLSAWIDSKQSRDIVELPQIWHRRPTFCGIATDLVRLSSTCWILIRIVVWTRLPASLCFFQRTASVLAPKLSRLFRRLLRCGEFPPEWWIADVTPIPRGPLLALVCNYQPISITPVLSKGKVVLFEFWSLFGEIWGPVISLVLIQEEFGYL